MYIGIDGCEGISGIHDNEDTTVDALSSGCKVVVGKTFNVKRKKEKQDIQ